MLCLIMMFLRLLVPLPEILCCASANVLPRDRDSTKFEEETRKKKYNDPLRISSH